MKKITKESRQEIPGTLVAALSYIRHSSVSRHSFPHLPKPLYEVLANTPYAECRKTNSQMKKKWASLEKCPKKTW